MKNKTKKQQQRKNTVTTTTAITKNSVTGFNGFCPRCRPGPLTDQVSKHGAERPQTPRGLLGTGRSGGKGYGIGGRGRLYTYRYTVTTRMIPALRWAAIRAILMFQ